MVKVILNADDFGLTAGITSTIDDLFHEGKISNSTAMMCVDGGVDRLAAYRNSDHIDRIGLHLQLTSGKPILEPKHIPSLVQPNGHFKPKDKIGEMSAVEVKLEWEAQLSTFRAAAGRMPSHIDSHHGPHRQRHLRAIYLGLARENELSVRGFDEDFFNEAGALGVRASKATVSGWTAKGENLEHLVERMLQLQDKLGSEDYIEVAMHPGVDDQELRNISSLTDLRENDTRVLNQIWSSGLFVKHSFVLSRHPLK